MRADGLAPCRRVRKSSIPQDCTSSHRYAEVDMIGGRGL
jgi:hypothetical protein